MMLKLTEEVWSIWKPEFANKMKQSERQKVAEAVNGVRSEPQTLDKILKVVWFQAWAQKAH